MQKGLYTPSNRIIIILQTVGNDHLKIFIDGEEKTVPKNDVEYEQPSIVNGGVKFGRFS